MLLDYSKCAKTVPFDLENKAGVSNGKGRLRSGIGWN